MNKDRKHKYLTALPGMSIIQIILTLYPIANLELEGGTKTLALYRSSGEKEGLYDMDENAIKRLIEQYNPSMTEKGIKDVCEKLERNAPLISLTRDKDLIPVNNGVFHVKI